MPIPKIIHYCWFGGAEKNALTLRCIDSWERYAPDCEIVEWNENTFDVTKNDYMRQAYEAKRWSFVSDYARLDIVYEYGGVYLDTDVELIKPIDELLNGSGFIGFEQKDSQMRFSINTGGGFGAAKNDSTIRAMRDYYASIPFLRPDGSENLQPCPLYNTEAMLPLGLKCDNTLQQIGSITVYPYEYFCPVNWKTHQCITTENTFSIHHFDASWLSEQEKKKRKRERMIDEIIHLPNAAAKTLLGEERYEGLKRKIKGSK